MTEETIEETVVEEQTSNEQETETEQRDFEAEAKEMRWVPKDEFKGDAKYWKDAEQFVLDGERITPIVSSQNKKLREELELQNRDFADRLAKMERMNKVTSERLQSVHEAEIADIKSRQRQAAADGDLEGYDNYSKRIDAMGKAAPSEEQPQNVPDDIEKAQKEFMEKNSWYNDDPVLHLVANGFSQSLNPNMSVHENLRRTKEKIKELFPEKFQTKPARKAAVDGGGVFSQVSKKAGPSASLPKEALARAKIDVANGVFKTVDEWAKAYNDGASSYDG